MKLGARVMFLAPAWLGYDDGERLEFLECPGSDAIALDGVLREQFLRGTASPLSRAIGQHTPLLSRLWAARERGQLSELDRATLLRGNGFSQLFLELTGRCNERCLHCYAQAGPERREALSAEIVRAALGDARELGFELVQLTGGDPLLSRLCVPAAELAASLGFTVEVYTNGLALVGTLYQQLRAAGVRFAFSFYSHDEAIHDAITQTPGSQRRTARAIARVVADGSPCRVSVVTMDQNRETLGQTYDYLRELGVPEARIGMDVQRSVGRGQLTIEPDSDDLPRLSGGHREQATEMFGGKIAITYEGQVVPCIFDRRFVLGDVRERRLAEILLDSVPLRVDRERVLSSLQVRPDELACWDCRVRAALLPGRVPPGNSLPLHR